VADSELTTCLIHLASQINTWLGYNTIHIYKTLQAYHNVSLNIYYHHHIKKDIFDKLRLAANYGASKWNGYTIWGEKKKIPKRKTRQPPNMSTTRRIVSYRALWEVSFQFNLAFLHLVTSSVFSDRKRPSVNAIRSTFKTDLNPITSGGGLGHIPDETGRV